MTNAPAGWHPDPAQEGSWRWWDGSQWTHQTTQTPPGQAAPGQPNYPPPTEQPSPGAPPASGAAPTPTPTPIADEPSPDGPTATGPTAAGPGQVPPAPGDPMPPGPTGADQFPGGQSTGYPPGGPMQTGPGPGIDPPPPSGPTLGPPGAPGQGHPGATTPSLNFNLEPIMIGGLAGFGIAALGTLLPWVGASFFSIRGTSDWRGLLSFLCAVAGAGLLFFFTQQKNQQLLIGAVAAGGLTFLLTLAFAADVSGSFGVGLRVGWFLTFLGTLAGGGIAIMTLLKERQTTP